MLLTIGIPVFNGAERIEKTLDSIIGQVEELKNEVEILVSDNSSTDGTVEIVERYRDQRGLIRIHRNKENYGADANIGLVVERADSRYVWLLGCGDIVEPNALKRIIEHLRQDDYDNVLLNFDIYNELLRRHDSDHPTMAHDALVIDDRNQFFMETQHQITVLSSIIVNKEAWSSITDTKTIAKNWLACERVVRIVGREDYGKSLWIRSRCFTLSGFMKVL